jgi:hypothetical protein
MVSASRSQCSYELPSLCVEPVTTNIHVRRILKASCRLATHATETSGHKFTLAFSLSQNMNVNWRRPNYIGSREELQYSVI